MSAGVSSTLNDDGPGDLARRVPMMYAKACRQHDAVEAAERARRARRPKSPRVHRACRVAETALSSHDTRARPYRMVMDCDSLAHLHNGSLGRIRPTRLGPDRGHLAQE